MKQKLYRKLFLGRIERCKKLHLKMKVCVEIKREMAAKLKDTLRKSILKNTPDIEIYQIEKEECKNKVDILKKKKGKHEK